MPLDPRLDKIRKLMALALNNPNEEEARSAALKAVQMMTDLACTISLSQPAAPAPPPMPSQPDDLSQAVYNDLLRDLYAQNQAQQQPNHQWDFGQHAAAHFWRFGK